MVIRLINPKSLLDIRLMEKLLSKTGVISNFTCIPQLIAFAVKKDKLFWINWKGHDRLIILRERNLGTKLIKDIRILFHRSEKDMFFIEDIKKTFFPSYVAYNLIPSNQFLNFMPSFPFFTIRNELVINIKKVANLEDKKLFRAYRRAQKRNGELRLVLAKKQDRLRIYKFLNIWCQQIEKKGHLGPNQKAENDRRLVFMYLGSPEVKFWLLINENNKIIGLSAYTYHPSDPKNLAVKIILKNLRGYTKLGQWFMIEEAKKLQLEGFKWALMGGNENPTQAKFKEEFMKGGKRHIYYSAEVYCDRNLSFASKQARLDYLRAIWG